MVRSDKNPLAEAGSPATDEGEEIDRIMQEIEDLEKKMDAAPTSASEPPSETSKEAETTTQSGAAASFEQVREARSNSNEQETESAPLPHSFDDDAASSASDPVLAKVVPMRPSLVDSLAETDAVPACDEPLMREGETLGEGGLSLKIGGCTEVNLEFTRSGMVVSLSCSDEGLRITTDQGAEFRIPFKRTA